MFSVSAELNGLWRRRAAWKDSLYVMFEGRTCRCNPGCSVTVLERDFGRAVGSVHGQLQVSGTNPGNFIRS